MKRAYIELHIATFLFGFTAILGKLIQLPAITLIWWRVVMTCASFFLLGKLIPILRETPRIRVLQMLSIGVLVALHWLCFYGAIKLANASIALVCIATTSFFTSFIEPFLSKKPIKIYELVLGFLVIPGMALIVNHTELKMINGVWVGILSAVAAAIFASLNKKIIADVHPVAMSFIELSGVGVAASLMLPFFYYFNPTTPFLPPSASDWGYLLILALLCTTFAYVLSLRALKHVSAFTSVFIINLEPVYGITMAWLLLQEDKELSPEFYWGVLLILGVVFSYPFVKKRFERNILPRKKTN